MSITALQIESLLAEIVPRLAGGTIRQAWCRNPWSFVLEVRQPGENHYLLFSLEEVAVRLHLVPERPEQPPKPPDFIMLLRKYLEGARFAALEQMQRDRVVRLRAEASGQPEKTLALLAELTGRHGNIFLLDRDHFILGSLLPNRSYRRKLVPGEIYQCPAPLPPAVEEAVWRDDLQLAALPADGSRSRKLEEFYDRAIRKKEVEALANQLLRRLRQEEEQLRRRTAAIAADLDRAAEARQYRKRGELLRSAYGQEVRGAEAIEVPDYYAEGMPTVSIPLEKTLDLKGNIERYFHLYRKYQAAGKQIEERLDRARKKHQKILQGLETAKRLAWLSTEGATGAPGGEGASPPFFGPEEGRARLEQLQRQLEEEKVLKPAAPADRAGKARAEPALPYREFRSKSGKAILVGKGGKENDHLTLRIARGNDLWLHAHDWAGAHVVVRLERDENIDEESLLDAATLAAHYSKGRNDTAVEVIYTPAKNVRKPKGLPPGRVSVADVRAIAIRLEKDRLERLFGKEE